MKAVGCCLQFFSLFSCQPQRHFHVYCEWQHPVRYTSDIIHLLCFQRRFQHWHVLIWKLYSQEHPSLGISVQLQMPIALHWGGTGHQIQYSCFFLFLSDNISEGLPFNLPTQRLASATCVLLALHTQSSNRLDLYKAYPINTEQLPTSVGIFAKSPFCCGLSSRNMLCISCKPTWL